MGRPRLYDDALRGLLIEKAGKLILTEGYHGVSLRVLTEQAGTSTNAIYTLFGSKEALMLEAVLAELNNFLDTVESAPTTDDAIADLLVTVMAYRNFAKDKPAIFGAIFEVLAESKSPQATVNRLSPEVLELDHRLFHPIDQACERVVNQKMGNADSRELAVAIWAFLHGYIALENAGVLTRISGSEDDLFEKGIQAAHKGWEQLGTQPS